MDSAATLFVFFVAIGMAIETSILSHGSSASPGGLKTAAGGGNDVGRQIVQGLLVP